MKRNFLVVIPARMGSKGIKGKNFLDLDGRPVISYSVEHALGFMEKCDILISTDHSDFLENLKGTLQSEFKENGIKFADEMEFIGEAIILHRRPARLAEDDTSIMSVLGEIIKTLESLGRRYIGILLMQPTVPFRSSLDRDRILHFLESEAEEDSSYVTFKKVTDCHPARMYSRIGSEEFESAKIFPKHQQSRRQDLPELFLRDGCYYFIGRTLILNGMQVLDDPKGFVREFPWNINLDDESDLILARASVATIKSYFN
jgi:CMP-N,N'-diacetyllegionaminic acid synthase